MPVLKQLIPKMERLGGSRVAGHADAAFFDYLHGSDTGALLDSLFDAEAKQSERVRALFTLLRSAIPDEIFNSMTRGRYAYVKDALPVDPKRYAFEADRVGSGFESYVYKLTPAVDTDPSLVVKIGRLQSENIDELVERGKQVRHEYESIRSWYEHIPELVPDEISFIAKSPRGGIPTLLTIQMYFGEELSDLLHDFSTDELVGMLQADVVLRDRFLAFADATIDGVNSRNEMIDTIGNKNLALVRGDSGNRIVILDPHVIKHPRDNPSKESDQLLADLDRIALVAAKIRESGSVPASGSQALRNRKIPYGKSRNW